MGNVIVHVVNVGALKGEEYRSQQPKNIVGNMETPKGGHEYRPFVSFALFMFLYSLLL